MDLGDALAAEDLTTLRVLRQTGGKLAVTASRDFDDDTDFAAYGRTLAIDHVTSRRPRVLGHAESVAALAKHGAGAALDALLTGMRAGHHEMVLAQVHAPLGVRLTHYVHSSTLGIQSGLHGIRAGGIRRHDPKTPGPEVMQDGLNLSRAMSYKCAMAELPYGGSKTTVQAASIDVHDDRRLGFIAWCIDRGNLITGPDVGFAPELIDRLAARFTRHILCGPAAPLGSTNTPTALGVFAAIRVARPGSPWAHFRYRQSPVKQQKAQRRADKWVRRQQPIKNWISEHLFGLPADTTGPQ